MISTFEINQIQAYIMYSTEEIFEVVRLEKLRRHLYMKMNFCLQQYSRIRSHHFLLKLVIIVGLLITLEFSKFQLVSNRDKRVYTLVTGHSNVGKHLVA